MTFQTSSNSVPRFLIIISNNSYIKLQVFKYVYAVRPRSSARIVPGFTCAPTHGHTQHTHTLAVITSAFVLIRKLFLKAFQLSDVDAQIHPLPASELHI